MCSHTGASKKITVIVPVYKAEGYLHLCVDSILAQTHGNLEIILVDDGSPDGSGRICDAYAARDDRVRVVHKANGGVSSARNAGLDLASGEYVSFIDADDWIESDFLESLFGRAEAPGANMVIGGFVSDNALYRSCRLPPNDNFYSRRDFLDFMLENIRESDLTLIWAAWNKLYRLSLLQGHGSEMKGESSGQIRFPDMAYAEDCCFTASCVDQAADGIAFCTTARYHYVQYMNPHSLTSPKTQQNESAGNEAENVAKGHAKWRAVFTKHLPEKSDRISGFAMTSDLYKTIVTAHVATLRKLPPAVKVARADVVKAFQLRDEQFLQLSGLALWLLPPCLYRLAFKLYNQLGLLRAKWPSKQSSTQKNND
jgi:glycosyltransferase involved in cell wall biosynthesis